MMIEHLCCTQTHPRIVRAALHDGTHNDARMAQAMRGPNASICLVVFLPAVMSEANRLVSGRTGSGWFAKHATEGRECLRRGVVQGRAVAVTARKCREHSA